MTSFLDNLNQSQLPRAGGYLLTLSWAHIFYRLPFPSRHPPPHALFPYQSHYFCPAVSLLPSQPAAFWKDLIFSWGVQVGICLLPPLSDTEQNLLNEMVYVATPCTRQARECYLSSLSFLEMPGLKKLFCQMAHSQSESLFLFPFLSPSPSLLRLTGVPINAKPLPLDKGWGRGGKEAWKL